MDNPKKCCTFQTEMFENSSHDFKNSKYYYKALAFNLMKILVSKHASNVPFIVVKYVVVYGIIYWAKVVDYLSRGLPEQDVSRSRSKVSTCFSFFSIWPIIRKTSSYIESGRSNLPKIRGPDRLPCYVPPSNTGLLLF